jgi:hypothetical protein
MNHARKSGFPFAIEFRNSLPVIISPYGSEHQLNRPQARAVAPMPIIKTRRGARLVHCVVSQKLFQTAKVSFSQRPAPSEIKNLKGVPVCTLEMKRP